jgi:hypothetical protein
LKEQWTESKKLGELFLWMSLLVYVSSLRIARCSSTIRRMWRRSKLKNKTFSLLTQRRGLCTNHRSVTPALSSHPTWIIRRRMVALTLDKYKL